MNGLAAVLGKHFGAGLLWNIFDRRRLYCTTLLFSTTALGTNTTRTSTRTPVLGLCRVDNALQIKPFYIRLNNEHSPHWCAYRVVPTSDTVLIGKSISALTRVFSYTWHGCRGKKKLFTIRESLVKLSWYLSRPSRLYKRDRVMITFGTHL